MSAQPTQSRLRTLLGQDTFSGGLLILGAIIALIWANSPWRETYHALANFTVGPEALHLNLTLGTWAADGLLAIFFFVVGVELKQEMVSGALSKPKEAAVPVLAAVGGMALPAIVFSVLIVVQGQSEALHGWAIPTATDIAFALAILGLFGKGLPKALRIFLMTLAVVDDLLAIIIIAIFYTSGLNFLALGGALAAVVAFALLVRMRKPHWWLLIPVALIAWTLMHTSGVHATIAGVLMGLVVPARLIHGETEPRTHRYEHAVSPISAGLALPIFAFFAAGVTIVGDTTFGQLVREPVFISVATALIVGKLLGVLGMTALVVKVTPLRLPDAIGVRDLLPVAFLCGIGFTVSLLIAELSYTDVAHTTPAKVAILCASVIAAILGAVSLRLDARKARHNDMNEDGVPDSNIELM